MHRLTASRLDLHDVCGASAHLPWQKDSSTYADDGTDRHEFFRRAAEGDAEGALACLPESLRDRMSRVDLEAMFALFPDQPRPEVAVAYDPDTDTARELDSKGHRDYSDVRPNEIAGTIDLIACGDDVVVVGDLKTGSSYVPHARESRQIHFAALAGSRLYGVTSAVGSMLKVQEDGSVLPLTGRWDSMGLDGLAADMRSLRDRARASTAADTVTGPACKWCPARTACPAIANQVQTLVEIDLRAKTLTPEARRRAWIVYHTYSPLFDQVKKWLKAEIEADGPIPLGNGKEVRLVERRTESLILESVLEQGKAMGLDENAILAAGTVSEKALREAFGNETTDKLIEACKAEHGFRVNVSTSMRECRER